MSLDDRNHDGPPIKSDLPCVEPSDYPITTLVIPLASCSPFAYDEQDWDVNNLL